MMATKTTASLDSTKIYFNVPERHDLASNNRYYYMQALTYNGEDLYLESDWFESDGVKFNPAMKLEMMFRSNGIMKESLDMVQSEALRQLIIPAEYNIAAEDKQRVYKLLPKSNYLFAKLGRGVQYFNQNCQPIMRESLAYGQYRVIIHVKGIYIGPHGDTPARASLQMKIKQIQYVPVFIPCLFSSSTKFTTPPASRPDGNAVSAIVPETPKARKTRKPKLQRQNAMIDASEFIVDLE